MLEEHCYITDVSFTIFKNELFNNLVVLETKIFKLLQSLLQKRWAKKGVICSGEVENCYTA